MSFKPQCSIVIPAYNVAAYIGETVASVLQQSLSNWELIVVDDGSTDKTVEVLRKFDDARMQILQQENRGVSAARNRGLQAVRSAAVLFLDGDDRLRLNALDRLSLALKMNPQSCLVYGEGIVMDERGNVFGTGQKPVFSPRPSGNVLATILVKNCILTTGAALVRKSFLDNSSVFHEDLSNYEDWELWCRLAAKGEFTYIGGTPVIEYRLRPDSLVRTDIGDVDRALQAVQMVFSNPAIKIIFSEQKFARLKQACQAEVFGKGGLELLKIARWQEARKFLLTSLKMRPWSLRVMILLLAACMRWVPFFLKQRIK